jgi:NitT/TauT family transport system permease protein
MGRRGRLGLGRKAAVYVPAAILILLAIGAWELYVKVSHVRPIILPPPNDVFSALIHRWSVLQPQLVVTAKEAALGFLLAAVAGIALAILITSSRILRLALYPLIVATQAMPVIAIAPLLIIWFGFGTTSKVFVAALVAFFPVVVNTAAGLESLDTGVVTLMRSFPASRLHIFLRARVPNALPQIFAGLKIAAVLSVIGAVVGEWVGAEEGLGYLIVRSNASFDTDLVFASIVLLSLLGIAFFLVVSLAETLALPWKRTSPS